jgi:hypothetical protein
MKVLIACEESQAVCQAFRELGHESYSCDIQDCSGGHPEWHIQHDAIEVAYSNKWDLMIAHPPCTHLSVSGARWFAEGVKDIRLRHQAANFFLELARAPIPHIAIENPVCVMSSIWRKPDQTIHPWQFGHPEQKATCLWLKNLPKLLPSSIVYDYMMTLPIKERQRIHWLGGGKGKERSKTFEGIAKAMALQWGGSTKQIQGTLF